MVAAFLSLLGPLFLSLAKNFLGKRFAGTIADIFEPWVKGLNDDKRFRHLETLEEIRADVKLAKQQSKLIIAEQGWWVTALIRPAFAYPLAAYYGAVIADSLFHFEWDVAALPEPINSWSGAIITSYFVVRSAEKIARGLVSRWHR